MNRAYMRRPFVQWIDWGWLLKKLLTWLVAMLVVVTVGRGVTGGLSHWWKEQASLPTLQKSASTGEYYLKYPDGKKVPVSKPPEKYDGFVWVQ